MTESFVLNVRERVIQAVTLEGARVRTLVDGLDEYPDGIVIDYRGGHVYWTNMGAADARTTAGPEPEFFTRNGSLERVDLDGGNRTTIVPRGAFTTGKQLTADFDARKLYWCDREGMQVLRCDLEGTNLESLVVTAVGDDAAHDAQNHCVGVAVDTDQRMLYWTQKGAPKGGQGRILRAPLDIPAGRTAVDRHDIEVLWSSLPEPIDLDLDGSGMLAWTDRGNPPAGNTLNRAQVTPTVARPQVCATDFHEAIGLATADGVIYYVSDLFAGHIRVVNLAEGTQRQLVDLGPGLTGIALANTDE